jgi:hypothetical protein
MTWAPERELVRQGALKPRAPRRRAINYAGVRDLQLAERQLISIPPLAVLGGKR